MHTNFKLFATFPVLTTCIDIHRITNIPFPWDSNRTRCGTFFSAGITIRYFCIQISDFVLRKQGPFSYLYVLKPGPLGRSGAAIEPVIKPITQTPLFNSCPTFCSLTPFIYALYTFYIYYIHFTSFSCVQNIRHNIQAARERFDAVSRAFGIRISHFSHYKRFVYIFRVFFQLILIYGIFHSASNCRIYPFGVRRMVIYIRCVNVCYIYSYEFVE